MKIPSVVCALLLLSPLAVSAAETPAPVRANASHDAEAAVTPATQAATAADRAAAKKAPAKIEAKSASADAENPGVGEPLGDAGANARKAETAPPKSK